MGRPSSTFRKRPLQFSDNSECPPSASSTRYPKRIRRTAESMLAPSLKIPPPPPPQPANSSLKSYADSYASVRLLSLPEAQAVLNSPGAVKGPFSNLPIVNLPLNDRLYTIIGMHSGSILTALPWGEHYALIDGELGRIKLKKTSSRRVGISPPRVDESKGQSLLSQFKEKSAIIKFSSESRSQSPTTSGAVPRGVKIEPGSLPPKRIGGLPIHRKSRGVELPPLGGAGSSSQALLSQFKEQSAAVKTNTQSRSQPPSLAGGSRRTLLRSNGPPPANYKTQGKSPLSQQSSALLNSSTLPDPPPSTPGNRLSSPGGKGGNVTPCIRDQAPWHKGNIPQSTGTRGSPAAIPVVSPRQPAASKSPALTEFAERLSSLTAAIYKATELLPQMALRDLEGVLENDWMVEDMEKMVMGVVSLVNGRGEEGERQWRRGGGNGKL